MSEYCVYCGENTAEEVEEEEKYKGKKYKAIFYRCTNCDEEFYTWGQIQKNQDRISRFV